MEFHEAALGSAQVAGRPPEHPDPAPLRLGCPLPPALERRLVVIAPGDALPYRADFWRHALVIVEFGRVGLACRSGRRLELEEGAMLVLTRLPLLAIHSLGSGYAVLAALTRRRADPGAVRAGSGPT